MENNGNEYKFKNTLVAARFDEAVARDGDEGHIGILHGLDPAMIGTATRNGHVVAVYERSLCIRCIAEGMDDEEVAKLHAGDHTEEELKDPELINQLKLEDAEEFYQYNTEPVLDYMGESAPIIIEGFGMDSACWGAFMAPDGPVKVTCYLETKTWPTRKEAIEFFKEAARHSEGPERDRYVRIFMQLEDGSMHAKDFEEEKVN